MNKIDKRCGGYDYSVDGFEWSIQTDYRNDNIYLDPPSDDSGLDSFKAFARALALAVRDMTKDMKEMGHG